VFWKEKNTSTQAAMTNRVTHGVIRVGLTSLMGSMPGDDTTRTHPPRDSDPPVDMSLLPEYKVEAENSGFGVSDPAGLFPRLLLPSTLMAMGGKE
jgi:hypothetical protein